MAFNPIHVIFGLKLRQARLEKGLSLTELAERARLSPSYVTEIEKGRKYPKADKILRLAQALGYDYDQLVSRRLDPPLAFLESSLTSQLLQDFPLEMFGVDPATVVELLTRSPAEMGALLQALRDMARGYNIREEHLYRAALRSYQEHHNNYFPDLEQAAARFAAAAGFAGRLPEEADLLRVLEAQFGYRTGTLPLERRPGLSAYRAVYLAEPGPALLLHPHLLPAQRKFALAREVGYRVLGLEDRSLAHPPDETESFTRVLNDFKAAYFGGALLMPEAQVVEDLRGLFQKGRWCPRALLDMLSRYGVMPEALLYRFSQLVPRFFGLRVHFLRFNLVEKAYRVYQQLNMSELSLPTGFDLREHYCRRWLTVRLLKELAGGEPGAAVVGIQRSRFLESQKQFLCFGMARQDNLPPYLPTSMILGLRFDENLHRTVRFAGDRAIPDGLLNETCERCPLSEEECSERAAPPVRWLEARARAERKQDLEALLRETGAAGRTGPGGNRAAGPARGGQGAEAPMLAGPPR